MISCRAHLHDAHVFACMLALMPTSRSAASMQHACMKAPERPSAKREQQSGLMRKARPAHKSGLFIVTSMKLGRNTPMSELPTRQSTSCAGRLAAHNKLTFRMSTGAMQAR